MRDIRRILVPTDFTKGARQALRHAVVLADRLAAELHVIHVVVDAGADRLAMASGWEAEAIRLAMEADVDRFHRNLIERAQPGPLPARCIVRGGTDVARVVLEYAREQQVDLIVLPWYENELDNLTGSSGTAARILRGAQCDVITTGIRGHYSVGRGASARDERGTTELQAAEAAR